MMKPTKTIGSILMAVSAAITCDLHGQIFKADNATSLDQGGSWVNGTAPGPSDIATWDSTVSAANCTNTLAAPANWSGIQILNPAAAVKISTNTSNPTLTLGTSGIDLSSATVDLFAAPSITTGGDQLWNIASGRTLSVGDTNKNVNLNNNVGVNGHLQYGINLRIQNGGTLFVTNSATTIETAPTATAGAQFLVGNSGIGNVVQTAGTVRVKRTDGTSGSPNASLTVANAGSSTATYTLTGGLLTDAGPTGSSALSYLLVAGGSGSSGILNVDGTGSVQATGLRLANAATATAVVNLTNGTMLFNGTGSGGEIDIGRASSAYTSATLNIYGGTFTAYGNLMVPHGNGPGFFNLSGGTVSIGGSMNVADTGTGSGVATISGGTITVTNSLNLPNGATGTGTVNLNGGTLTVTSVAHPGAASGTLNLNGGTLRARSGNANFIASGVTANIMAGGAVVDTTGSNPTIPAALRNGTGGGADGGLTKLGAGTLTLTGASTFTGPTTIAAGALSLTTTNLNGGGALSLSNATLLHLALVGAPTTMNCSSLILGSVGASSGGALTNEFDFDGLANPATPFIDTPSLAVAGTVYVNIFGSGLSANTTYHLIHYTSNLGGSDFAFTAGLISGAVGYVTNNTATHYVDLVVTALPSLVWRAQVNTNWDTSTANWVDLGTGLQATYPNGGSVLFNDSTSNGLVYATGIWSPATAVINNAATNYTFTGVGRISGVTGLTKLGAGSVSMGTTNDYSGDTVISNGTFKITGSNVIPDGTGKGNVVLEGKLDLNGFSEAVNGLTGGNGIIDNSAGGSVIFTMGNGGGSGVFGGQITNSTGSLGLTVSGGNLVLLAKNGYSGGTSNRGSLQLAYEQSIGTGPLALQGSLLWMDTAAHTLTNPLTITGGTTFGADTNGPLTIPGTVNLAGANRTFSCNSDVLMQNGATNGGFSGKGGPGTLTVKNLAGPDWFGGSFALNNGTFILDNALSIEDGNNFRIQCTATNGLARLVITNGASIIVSNSSSSNFRFGDSPSAGPGATNLLDLAGTLNIISYGAGNNKFQMGSGTDPAQYNIANLLPGGVLITHQVVKAPGCPSISVFNFDGGKLSPSSGDLGTTFMQTLDACYVLDRGATIDTAGFDITIGQSLQAGGTGTGGMTKLGAGTLRMNGFSSYTGPTLVTGGAFGGVGTVSSPVTVASGTTLIAGLTNTTIGTFGIFNNLTLAGGSFTLMKVNPDSVSADQVYGVNILHAGGTLIVTNLSLSPFVAGDTFYLFTATTYTGAFASLILPPLPDTLAWNTGYLLVDGSLRVVSRPVFTSFVHTGSSLVLSGTNGMPFANFYLLSSTNVALPLANWTRVETNAFDDQGNFSVTNALSPSVPRLFYALQAP